MRVIDLTHTIKEDMPVYPGTETPTLKVANTYETDGFKETILHMYSHTGTHIDAPAHIFKDAKTLDMLPPEQFIGKAAVIDCRGLKSGENITMEHIRSCAVADDAEFLLFNLGWDEYWGKPEYFGEYPCIDDQVLEYIIAGKYKGIGFDVIGLDPIYNSGLRRHKRLLGALDIINIENLRNLHLCGDGLFDFACLPLKFENSDGAPARAIAWLQE